MYQKSCYQNAIFYISFIYYIYYSIYVIYLFFTNLFLQIFSSLMNAKFHEI